MRKGEASAHFENDPDTPNPWLPSRTCSDSGMRRVFSTLLKNDGDKAVVRSPEKAGVGGSTPSLATMFSISLAKLLRLLHGAKSLLSWVEQLTRRPTLKV